MTRRRKDPFGGKENVRHFRLVHRPLGSAENNEKDSLKTLSFDDLFEEYDPSPSGSKYFKGQEVLETEEFYEDDNGEEGEAYDFLNDDDGEMVDIDAELDQFSEEFIDIEGEDGLDRVKMVVSEEKVGEAAKYGILLDDRDYDYTKHLRRVGITPGAVFIQAPGMKKEKVNEKKPRDFFTTEEVDKIDVDVEVEVEEEVQKAPSEDLLKINHEIARQQYRALLQQVSDDPMLREVIEALEDDRYVTEEVDDELVISLDNMNINKEDEDENVNEDYFDEDVEILGEDEEFPDFIPSDALKRQMEKIAAQEAKYSAQERDELDDILDEYDDDDDEGYNEEDKDYLMNSKEKEFVDIEGEGSEIDLVDEEEAANIYKYLREHGRARGTTLYEKKRPSHLPPIHIAIAQYNELRRELAVNNDLIIQKYSQEDEEETKRQIRESEKIIEEMVKIIDDPEEMEKRLNIETAKNLMKLSESANVAGPRKIVESLKKSAAAPVREHFSEDSDSDRDSETEYDGQAEAEKVNKGVARSADETVEEKKARKAKIKAEKREKRAVKADKKNRK